MEFIYWKVLKGSYERFLEFIKRSNAVSPTVAMETATALQASNYLFHLTLETKCGISGFESIHIYWTSLKKEFQ